MLCAAYWPFCAARTTSENDDALVEPLAQNSRPALLVSRVPSSGHSQACNYYFESGPEHGSMQRPTRSDADVGGRHAASDPSVSERDFIPGDAAGIPDTDDGVLRWAANRRRLPWARTKRGACLLTIFAAAAVG